MFTLPPEWHPQSSVMLTWPNHTNIWKPSLAEVEFVFVQIAKHIAKKQNVIISCLDQDYLEHVSRLLSFANVNMNHIQLYAVPSLDVWARDHGPITVFNNKHPILLDFIFNGWGDKYPASLDNQVTQKLHQQGAFADTPIQTIDIIMEGGSIEVDGCGTLLTTTSCLCSPKRNAHFTQADIEEQFKYFFGVKKILWLDHGYLAGDDTDGHIDTLARFTDPNTICYVHCDDPSDEHFAEFQRMEEQLKTFTNAENEPYHCVPLPWPQAKYNQDGQRLPATYANFLIINQAILVPTYDDPADQIALRQLERCFPNREIIDIPCLPLIEQFGSLHCVTMQIPTLHLAGGDSQ